MKELIKELDLIDEVLDEALDLLQDEDEHYPVPHAVEHLLEIQVRLESIRDRMEKL